MTNLDKILTHTFVTNLLDDSKSILIDYDFNLSDIELEKDPAFSEFEYYIHNTGFYAVHLLELCKQLENALELFSNFNYSKKKISRGDHITYNIENYIIRLSSLTDRILQTINAVFHLGIDENDVNERVIIRNIKVSRTETTKHFNKFKKTLNGYSSERNTIVHRHSYLNNQLKRIQMFYHLDFVKKLLNEKPYFKHFRKQKLTEFIKEKKEEYHKTNESCFESMLPIFNDLNLHYEKMKQKLK